MRASLKKIFPAALLLMSIATKAERANPFLAWPEITSQQKPWTYWWWMGSAVDEKNIKKELARYRNAGLGGVHIIPIYGARGYESNYVKYLSPHWMQRLDDTVREADRLGLGVDMTTGTGWCFGGPEVSDAQANASVVVRTFDLAAGERLPEKFDRMKTQALVAFAPGGKAVELTETISADGSVAFSPPGGTWRVYAISQKPSGQKVKRAAPGGEGWMLNPFYLDAMTDYLKWFDGAFTNYHGFKPRAQYQDSYEYRSDWSPDFFSQFFRRRGYRLQAELPALFGSAIDDHALRVKCDYRETISDLMADATLPLWVKWSHDHGFITRYEAHGSPGNLLDLYALADIPETEMFHNDRDKLVCKFASSAAHVAGHRYASAETGTWLAEHFTETLADMKFLVDDMFLSGINHIFYHGCCYSPDEAGWPGWLFYASCEMNPRNAIWRDTPALNSYVARCQSILQSGRPDNDILIYWPIHDFWSQPGETLLPELTVQARGWFESQPIGKLAQRLFNHGYQFDYVSDRQLASASATNGFVSVPGGFYRTIIVPGCHVISLETMRRLVALAEKGATVIFAGKLPEDISGLKDLENGRDEFKKLVERVNLCPNARVGEIETELTAVKVRRETMFDQPGLLCTRRVFEGGRCYFIANRGTLPVDGEVPLAVAAKSVVILDPMTGATGTANSFVDQNGTEVRLQLAPGESVILRVFEKQSVPGEIWSYLNSDGEAVPLRGNWSIEFISGGPVLPAALASDHLDSWTALGGTNAQAFAGTARYALRFDWPTQPDARWCLDLGKVCQSARVRLNGREWRTLITPPFRVVVTNLKPKQNLLEVEVTNVSANRIRDLDRRGVKWKNFHDINFVSIDYHPFDASNWPLTDSGLLGPVTLTPE